MKNLKTKMKKVITMLLLLVVCVSSIHVDEIYAANSIRLNKDYVQGTIGKKVQLKVLGTKKKVTWSSDNTRVAMVNAKGVVTGKRQGEAFIIAKVGNKKLYCDVFSIIRIGKTVKMIYIPYQKLWFITQITTQKPTNRLKS